MAVWIGLAVAAAIILVAGIRIVIRGARRALDSAEADAQSELRGETPELVDAMANSFGVQSAGAAQVRGNGTLALTSTELVFVQAIPRKTIRIPRTSITEVDEVRSHLGKTKGTPLLRVGFTDAQGRNDAVAWAVRDLGAWIAALRPVP